MKRFSAYLLSVLVLLPALWGCRENMPSAGEGQASLSIELSLPGNYAPGTRSGYADGDVSEATVDGSNWSDWERIVDGQRFYHLTIFIIRKSDNTLVAYRDLYAGSGDYEGRPAYGINGFCDPDGNLLPGTTRFAKAAHASFIYNQPRHGDIEKLTPGEYRMMVVANYSSVSGVDDHGVTKTYGGLADQATPFYTTVSNIISAFGDAPSSGIAFSETDYPLFFHAEVHSVRNNGGTPSYSAGDEQYICEQRPQPLSLIKDFTLFSGENSVSGELVRTYSRIRFSLENISSTNKLSFDGFSLKDSEDNPLFTAQKSIYLFDDASDAGFTDFASGAGVPVTDSPFAIVPWSGAATTLDESSGEMVFFDAYILESRRGDDKYRYALDLGYKDPESNYISSTRTEYSLNHTPNQGNLTDFNSSIDAGNNLFLLQVARRSGTDKWAVLMATDQYLRQSLHNENTDSPKPSSLDQLDTRLNESGGSKYLWRFSRQPDGLFLIQNLFTENYVGTAVGGLGTEPVTIAAVGHKFRIGTHTAGGYTGFYIQDSEVGAAQDNVGNCWNDYSNGGQKIGYYKYSGDSGSVIYFYPVTATQVLETETHFNDNVTLSLIDNKTSNPYDATQILRNDYIRVRISASYYSDKAYFRFIVDPWGRKDETLEFD